MSAASSPSAPVIPPPLSATTIGIDIGGTKINAALVEPGLRGYSDGLGDSAPPSLMNVPTPAESAVFLDTLTNMINTLSAGQPVAAVGISTAGVVDSINGRILGSTGNMPALNNLTNLRDMLEQRVNLPIHIENDANAAAYGEWRCGAAIGATNMFAITLGTGVGMGIVFNQSLYRGAHFYAGEGGHIAIDYHRKRQCTCGRWDCWEAFASGKGLQTTAERNVAAASESLRQEFLETYCQDNVITTYAVIAAKKAGHRIGIQVLDDWHHHIAVGLGSLINVMDPDMIVVGGGLAQFVDFELLTERTRERTMSSAFRLVPAKLGNYAGIVGAACLASDRHSQSAEDPSHSTPPQKKA
jgi:glucokinase